MSTASFSPDTAAGPPETVLPEPHRRARSGDEAEHALAGPLRAVLSALGEDPERTGLRETPARMARAYRFLTSGYGVDPHVLLRAALVGAVGSEMVLVKGVEFFALSEQHLMPFFGRAHVAYLPKGNTIEAETVARVVDAFARRLQTQERLTRQIHDALQQEVAPRGVAVALEGWHSALLMRGPEKQHTSLTTQVLSGAFLRPDNRGAFTRLIRRHAAGT